LSRGLTLSRHSNSLNSASGCKYIIKRSEFELSCQIDMH